MRSDEQRPAGRSPESPTVAAVLSDLAVTTAPLKEVDSAAPEPSGDVKRCKWDVSIRVDADLLIVDLMPSQADGVELNTHQLVMEIEQARSVLQRLLGDAEPNDPTPPSGPRRKPTRAYRPWTATEERKLADLYAAGWSTGDLAHQVRRTSGAINSRLIRLKERGTISSDPAVKRGDRSRPGREPEAAVSNSAASPTLEASLRAAGDTHG